MELKLDEIELTSEAYSSPIKNIDYLSLPYRLTINKKDQHVSFMVFASIPYPEELDKLLQKDNFKIMLIDDGADLVFEKMGENYTVYSTADKNNKEIVTEEGIRILVSKFWEELDLYLATKPST